MPTLLLVLGITGLVSTWTLSMGLDVLERDAAGYAASARAMAESGDYMRILDRGRGLLDKPHLLFWTAAASFEALGVSNWTYRLPSFLAFLLGCISVFGLARRYGSRDAASFAVVVYATTQGAFLMISDVRTDTLLTGLVAFSLWQCSRLLDRPNWPAALATGIGLGLGFMTKGLLAVAVVALAVVGETVATGRWRRLARAPALAAGAGAVLLTTPMWVALQHQFGAEGARFFLWTQGFGRVTETGRWGDAHGPFYLVPQLLWIFFPWTLMLAAAFGAELRKAWEARRSRESGVDWFTLSAFLLTFVGLSASTSKLPHYVYVTLPAAAVMTGRWIHERWDDDMASVGSRAIVSGQFVILLLAAVLIGGLTLWIFPMRSVPLWIALIVLAGATVTALSRSAPWMRRLLPASVLAVVALNLAGAGHVTPSLLAYQSSSAAGHWLESNDPYPQAPVFASAGEGRAFDFYVGREVTDWPEDERPPTPEILAIALVGEADRIHLEASADTRLLAEFDHFHVSKVTTRFLIPATRSDVLEKRYLLLVCAESCP